MTSVVHTVADAIARHMSPGGKRAEVEHNVIHQLQSRDCRRGKVAPTA